ncbi:MAG: hypothetical protein KC766_20265 [Myxococcales bacterium]|nr:hypothetical protein [Myxococcales bacterium]
MNAGENRAPSATERASEVRGVWFVTAAQYCAKHFGATALREVADDMPAPHRDTLLNPDGNVWYPESMMQTSIAAMERVLARGDANRFTEIIEGCTEEGVGLAFRVFLRVTTPAFVIRQIPFMWRQIRRGRGKVEVTPGVASASVRYSDFPYFDDGRYRRLTEGSLRALVRIATRREPEVHIADFTRNSLHVDIKYFR